MEFIDKAINDNDPLVSVGTFSMVEGAILYSNFAYLKHFQSQGKNKATNIVRGINFSVRDENLHSEGGAWSFKYLAKERGYGKHDMEWYERKMKHTASIIYDHECKVIDKLFEKGPIDGITALQLKNFVQSRLNVCLNQMGFTKMYDVKYNPIGEWFYKGINNYQFNDFFSGQGNQYHRNWDEDGFEWKKEST